MTRQVDSLCAVVVRALVFFWPLLLLGGPSAQAEVVAWQAAPLHPEQTFAAGLAFNVSFVGAGSDLTVQWLAHSNLSGVAVLLRVDGGQGGSSRYLPPTLNPNATDQVVLEDFIPAAGVGALMLHVSLLDAATNATLPNRTYSFLASTDLGRQAFGLTLSGDIDGGVTFTVHFLTYQCRWVAYALHGSEAFAELDFQADNTWECVVPKEFDDRLPAGTNFTMAVYSFQTGVELPPVAPVVVATGAVATGLALPKGLCTGSNVSVAGFFFATKLYTCSFGPSSGMSPRRRPVSPNLILCALPYTKDATQVDHIEVWEWDDVPVFVAGFKESVTLTRICSSDDDEWPWWAWIIVGLAAVGGLTAVMGVAALVYVSKCKRQGGGDYEQLVYADNPVVQYYDTGDLKAEDDHRLPISRKVFN